MAKKTDNKLGHIHLGKISNPDYIPEIASLFQSLENLEWMLCSGIFKNQIFFSIRSKNELTAGINAEKIAKKLKGSGGGHSNKGAGQIPIKTTPINDALNRFIATFKTLLNIKDVTGHPISSFKYNSVLSRRIW